MRYHRLQNPKSINWSDVTEKLDVGDRVVVQFSQTGYSESLLSELDTRAASLGDSFEIRFYDHQSAFDARILARVSNARRLSVDCMTKAIHLDALTVMRDIHHLSLGVYEGDLRGVLSLPALQGLESLSLGETKNRGIDLKPLGDYPRLQRLHVTGHATNIESLTASKTLIDLSLSQMRKDVELSFISRMSILNNLLLLLGGRDSIEEICNEGLHSLKIIRVKGLQHLGDIGRFPNLRSLEIEDQIQLKGLSFTSNDCLQVLRIVNCKTFASLLGLSSLTSLRHLRIGRTAIPFDQFIANEFPASLKCLAFYTGKTKQDAGIKRTLEAKGYSEYDER